MTDLTFPQPRSAPAPAAAPPVVPASAIAAAIFFLAIFVRLLGQSGQLLSDPDTHWHIAVGEWVWTHKAVPWTDIYSYTYAGAPWIAKEWLSQLALFAAYDAAGWRGVAVETALAVSVSFTLIYVFLCRRVPNVIAIGVALCAFLLADAWFLARPHALALPFMIAWIVGIVSALERKSVPPFWLALLMIPWANMHASFPIGLVLAGILAGEGVFGGPRSEWRGQGLRWGAFLVVSALAASLSPYGLESIRVAIRLLDGGEALRYIGEWRPLDLDFMGFLDLGALAASLVLLAQKWRTNLFRLLAVALLGYLMVRHTRFGIVFAVLTPVIIARPLGGQLGILFAESKDLGAAWGKRLGLAAFAVLITAAAGASAFVRPQPDPSVTPEAALAVARAHGVSGPVYNNHDFGGYLIAQGVKTFIDGRSDQLFVDGFFTRVYDAIMAKDDAAFAGLLDQYRVTWAIVAPGLREARHFARLEGWSKLYEDKDAAVFIRGCGRETCP